MTFLWMDGFESDRTPAALQVRYEDISWVVENPVGEEGRMGGYSFPFKTSDTFRTPPLNVSNNVAILGVGLWISDIVRASETILLQVSVLTRTNQTQCALRVWAVAGTNRWKIGILEGATEVILPTEFDAEAWFFLEWKVNVHPVTGFWELRVNNSVLASSANVNMAGSFSVGWYRLTFTSFFGTLPLGEIHIDDLYILDGSAVFPNDFLGPGVVQSIYPLVDAEQNDWIPAYGGIPPSIPEPHALLVDDPIEPDDENTRLEDQSEEGDTESIEVFEYSTLTRIRGAILGVQASLAIKQELRQSKFISQGAFYLVGFWWGSHFTPPVSAGYNRAWAIAGYNIPLGYPWNTATVKQSHFGFRREQ